MNARKSRTRQALELNRRALVDAAIADTYAERGDGWNAAHHRDMSEFHGKLTRELLAPPETLPDVRHGEVMPAPDSNKALGLRDTLRTRDMPAIDASARFPRLSPADFADGDHRGLVVGGAVGDDVYWSCRLPASFRALTPR